jgi:hypothetical protein
MPPTAPQTLGQLRKKGNRYFQAKRSSVDGRPVWKPVSKELYQRGGARGGRAKGLSTRQAALIARLGPGGQSPGYRFYHQPKGGAWKLRPGQSRNPLSQRQVMLRNFLTQVAGEDGAYTSPGGRFYIMNPHGHIMLRKVGGKAPRRRVKFPQGATEYSDYRMGYLPHRYTKIQRPAAGKRKAGLRWGPA